MKTVPDKVVRFGVIGVGGMGQDHCKSIRDIEEAKLAAVCDHDAATGEKAGKEFHVPFFTSHKQLIRAKLCDAVLVATPHPLRPEIAVDCANAGLHILSEKPLSERVSTADKMIAVARRNNIVLGVDLPLRTEPEIVSAIEFVRGGGLGRVKRCVMILPKYRSQAYYDAGGWRGTWRGEGGGVMMNQSSHVLDLFILLGGMPRRVLGRAATRLHHIEVEDLAEAILEYPGGGTGYFYCSTNEAGPGEMIEIFGDAGKLCYRDGKLTLFRFEPPIAEFTRNNQQMWGSPKCTELPVKIKDRKGSGYANIIRNFARHILFGDKLFAPGEEGLWSLELANAVYLSAHQGKPVDLPINRKAYDRFLAKMRKESTFRKNVIVDKRETDPNN